MQATKALMLLASARALLRPAARRVHRRAVLSMSDGADFSKIDLRVGTIVEAWNHPDSEKLIVEEIDLGEADGPRQIVSGLRDFYVASGVCA